MTTQKLSRQQLPIGQLSLVDDLLRFGRQEAALQDRFLSFHAQNPQVYQKFRQFAHEARKSRQRYGAKSIMERCRWHTDIEQPCRSAFKINNSFTSRYARLLIGEDPSFSAFFETRALKA